MRDLGAPLRGVRTRDIDEGSNALQHAHGCILARGIYVGSGGALGMVGARELLHARAARILRGGMLVQNVLDLRRRP